MRGTQQTDGSIWSQGYRALSAGLVLTVVAAAFESLSVATIMPAAVADIGGLSLYGWAFTAFMLTTIVGLAIAGGVADRTGPRRPYLFGVLLFAAGLLIAGLASNMVVLVGARAVQGLGAGLISSVAYIVVGRLYPEATRPTMLALISTAYVAPSLVGPAVASLIAVAVGWRWVFLGLAPLLPLAASLALPALRTSQAKLNHHQSPNNVAPAVGLSTGVGLVMVGLSSQSVPSGAMLFGVGGILAVSSARSLLPKGGGAGLTSALWIVMLLNMGFFGLDAFLPLALTTVRQQALTFAGLTLTAATLSWTAGSWLQARLAKSWGKRRLVTLGLILATVGVSSTLLLLVSELPIWLVPIAWACAGLGMGLASPTLMLAIFELAPSGQDGQSTSVAQLAGVLGIALSTGVGGVIVGSASSSAEVVPQSLLWHGFLMVAFLGLALFMSMRLPGNPNAATKPTRVATSL